jgi:hypothetical protein
MPLDAEIYFKEFPYKNSWQYHLAVPIKHIKGMTIPLAMLFLADLQNFVFYKGKHNSRIFDFNGMQQESHFRINWHALKSEKK